MSAVKGIVAQSLVSDQSYLAAHRVKMFTSDRDVKTNILTNRTADMAFRYLILPFDIHFTLYNGIIK